MFSNKLLFLKVICLQSLWYFFVKFGSDQTFKLHAITLALFVFVLNLKFYKNKFSLFHNFVLMIFFSLYGLIETLTLSSLNFLNYEEFPYWLIAMYIIFLCYYGDIFDYLKDKSWYILSLIGAVGGVFAFYAGVNIAKLQISYPYYYFAIAFSWALFFPVSIKMFYLKDMQDKILDFSIFYSFDKSGFLRHEKQFNDKVELKSDMNVLITGGTSGIGLSVAKKVLEFKANPFVVGRDSTKGEEISKLGDRLVFIKHDMQDWDGLDDLIKHLPILDVVVLNAGGMPEKFQKNNYGVESQMASQLFGHYFLIKKLVGHKKISKNARIIWVSSGGMYLKKLTLKNIMRDNNYDKVSTYAVVKRAQVELLDYFKSEFKDYTVVGMHPGWVDTPGVQSAISSFAKLMDGRLRIPEQGADTICWLMSKNVIPKSGEFYFDRSVVRKNVFWFTKVDSSLVEKLYQTLNNYYEKIK